MLVDPKFQDSDPILSILAAINNGPSMPQRIDKGMFIASHWNVGNMVDNVRDRWEEDEWSELPVPGYGVCDSPKQLMEKFDFDAFPEPVFVSFVKITKEGEPRNGGWRWHKWGEYIGDQYPQCEYIHDEPNIDEVYTFSVHELKS